MADPHTHPQPQSQPSPDSLMADFLSAEDLQRLVMKHAIDEIHSKEDAKARKREEKLQRMEMFKTPRELTPAVIERAVKRWQAAAKEGAKEVEIMRFPSDLCSDGGRAINNGESDWGKTLVGVPAQVYEIWSKYLRSRGFHLKALIVDFPDGMPGDVGMFISWS